MPKAKIKKEKPESKKIRKAKKTKEEPSKTESPTPKILEKYYEEVGRRKTVMARVRLFTRGEKGFLVNERPLENYFPLKEYQQITKAALEKMNCLDRFRILVRVRGGGLHSQAEAIRHGIAKALVLFNPNFKKRLSKAGFLTRDPRMKERKKFGLKRARKAPQWSKR